MFPPHIYVEVAAQTNEFVIKIDNEANDPTHILSLDHFWTARSQRPANKKMGIKALTTGIRRIDSVFPSGAIVYVSCGERVYMKKFYDKEAIILFSIVSRRCIV